MYTILAVFAVFTFVYSALAGRLEQTRVGGAILFTAFGLISGPLGFGFLNLDITTEGLKMLAEFALAIVLFTDAAHADLGVLVRSFKIPQKLLMIGLPLTILLGFAHGVLIFNDLSMLEIAILATMLAPTDAALGKVVVTNKAVPARIPEGLNVESGLNDGICVPVLFIFLAFASGEAEGSRPLALVVTHFVKELGIGMGVGLALSAGAAWILRLSAVRGWVSEHCMQIPIAALALACFAVAQAIGGSGFVASFVGGIAYGKVAQNEKERLLLAAEGVGDTFVLITWVVFGAAVVGQALGHFGWQAALYAVLSLSVIRMVPAFLSLAGMGLTTDTKLFLGWFGPLGLASIVFGVIVLNKNLPGGNELALVVVCTVIMSIVAHGLTANPLAAAYGARMSARVELASK